MKWEAGDQSVNFRAADDFRCSGDWYLVLWTHSQCRGWQLYRKNATRKGRHTWIVGAGEASALWPSEQAEKWAEEMIQKHSQS